MCRINRWKHMKYHQVEGNSCHFHLQTCGFIIHFHIHKPKWKNTDWKYHLHTDRHAFHPYNFQPLAHNNVKHRWNMMWRLYKHYFTRYERSSANGNKKNCPRYSIQCYIHVRLQVFRAHDQKVYASISIVCMESWLSSRWMYFFLALLP